VALAGGELVCRSWLAAPDFEPRDPNYVPGLYVAHPARGFAYASKFEGRVITPDFDVAFATDERGLRVDGRSAKGARGANLEQARAVLAVGDSFTAGWGVAYEQAWPARLQARWNAGRDSGRVKMTNAGVSGYSLRQVRLLAGELLAGIEIGAIVLEVHPWGYVRIEDPYTLLDGQLFQASALPHVRAAPGGFSYTPFRGAAMRRLDGWLCARFWMGARLVRLAALGGPAVAGLAKRLDFRGEAALRESLRREFGPLLAEIAQVKELADGRGIPLVLLLANTQSRDGSFTPQEKRMNGLIAEFCREREIAVFDPLPLLEDRAGGRAIFRFAGDGHWNAAAHEVVAEGFADFLASSGW
jgi:lysophospholipase L1-like esterase